MNQLRSSLGAGRPAKRIRTGVAASAAVAMVCLWGSIHSRADEVTDWNRYREYTKLTPAAIERYGGRFIVRGGDVVTLEGPQEKGRVVIIEFPNLDQAKAFYASEEYSQARKLREGAAIGQFLAVEGCAT